MISADDLSATRTLCYVVWPFNPVDFEYDAYLL